jgi:hypothetical protein
MDGRARSPAGGFQVLLPGPTRRQPSILVALWPGLIFSPKAGSDDGSQVRLVTPLLACPVSTRGHPWHMPQRPATVDSDLHPLFPMDQTHPIHHSSGPTTGGLWCPALPSVAPCSAGHQRCPGSAVEAPISSHPPRFHLSLSDAT